LRKVPSLAVDGILIEDGKVLLVQRAHEPFKGCWSTPGGFVEFGERLSRTAEREFLEETGIMARPIQIVGIYDNPKRDPRGHVIGIAYLMKRKSGKLKVSSESFDVRFFPVTKLPKAMAYDSKNMIKDALKLLKKK